MLEFIVLNHYISHGLFISFRKRIILLYILIELIVNLLQFDLFIPNLLFLQIFSIGPVLLGGRHHKIQQLSLFKLLPLLLMFGPILAISHRLPWPPAP